jgi:hypothetical protein
MPEVQKSQVIIRMPKSVALSVVLSLIFGPLGMLYSTVSGALIMLIITPIVAIPTLGFGLFMTQPICAIWAAVATNSYNTKMLQS